MDNTVVSAKQPVVKDVGLLLSRLKSDEARMVKLSKELAAYEKYLVGEAKLLSTINRYQEVNLEASQGCQ